MMAVLTITNENFEAEVLQADKPVLLDFWASWCGPCRMVSPVVDQIAAERTDIKVGKINVDEQGDLAQQFGVMSIPTDEYSDIDCDEKRQGCQPRGGGHAQSKYSGAALKRKQKSPLPVGEGFSCNVGKWLGRIG